MHKRNTNKTTTKNYNLGLNLGTASIGWALTDNHDKVLNHVRGKRAIGTRMFKEGESAADRRYFRSSRRRLARRKWRLRLLKEMFDVIKSPYTLYTLYTLFILYIISHIIYIVNI